MLHVATVHHRSPRWIEIQTRYLRAHISVPYLTWASLFEIDKSYAAHFDRVVIQGGRHSDKLNHLAIEISHEASDDDLLMFLDGDAFPIADPLPLITESLAKAPLMAVRRAENDGDRQPHPCFCVTTIGAWRKLPGDWSEGYTWVSDSGRRVTDVGANLLRQLELTQTPWVEVLRSNRVDLDPVFYAIYGDTVYHHGAGFRKRHVSRASQTGHASPARPHGLRQLAHAPGLRQLAHFDDRRKRTAWERQDEKDRARRSGLIYARIAQGGSDWLADLM